MGYSSWGCKELDTTEQLTLPHFSLPVLTALDRTSTFLPRNRAEKPADSGKSPEEGNSNPLQYSCLENSMDRGAWWATVHWVVKSQT